MIITELGTPKHLAVLEDLAVSDNDVSPLLAALFQV